MHCSCPGAECSISWPDICKLIVANIVRRHILQRSYRKQPLLAAISKLWICFGFVYSKTLS